MFYLMLFMFFCFLGITALLFYLLRSQERYHNDMREEHAQISMRLQALEQAMTGHAGDTAPLAADRSVLTGIPAGALSHLSLDGPTEAQAVPTAPTRRPAPLHDPALELHLDAPRR